MRGLTRPPAATLTLAALLLLASLAHAAGAQEQGQALVVVAVPRDEYLDSLKSALATLAYAPTPALVKKRPVPCPGTTPSAQPGALLKAALQEALRDAIKAVEDGDSTAFHDAKGRAYRIIACYSLPQEYAKAAAPLLAGEPADPGMEEFIVYAPALSPSGFSPLPLPAPQPPSSTTQPHLPPAGGGGSPGGPSIGGGGGGGEGGEVRVPRPPSTAFDVDRLLEILGMLRNATAPAQALGAPALPSLPRPGPRLVLASALLLAIAAGWRQLAQAVRGATGLGRSIASMLKRGPSALDARRCYSIAVRRAAALADAEKLASETPREYLARASRLLPPIPAAALAKATRAYEEAVYGMRPVSVERGVCELREV